MSSIFIVSSKMRSARMEAPTNKSEYISSSDQRNSCDYGQCVQVCYREQYQLNQAVVGSQREEIQQYNQKNKLYLCTITTGFAWFCSIKLPLFSIWYLLHKRLIFLYFGTHQSRILVQKIILIIRMNSVEPIVQWPFKLFPARQLIVAKFLFHMYSRNKRKL